MTKIMIAIPCRDKIDVLTVQSLFNLRGRPKQIQDRVPVRAGYARL